MSGKKISFEKKITTKKNVQNGLKRREKNFQGGQKVGEGGGGVCESLTRKTPKSRMGVDGGGGVSVNPSLGKYSYF